MLSSTSFFNARLQSNNNSNTVSILGHKYVLWTAQSHFNPCLAAQAKMTLSRANAKINSIVLINETTPCLAVATVIAQSQQGMNLKFVFFLPLFSMILINSARLSANKSLSITSYSKRKLNSFSLFLLA